MISHAIVNEFNTIFAGELSETSTKRRSEKWKCKLTDTLIGEYLITPLTSAKMLKSEGYWMDNCCHDYTRQCEKLEYCIFSIRKRTGERLATLGISNDRGSWSFDQCYGPSNSEVLEEIYEYLDEDEALQFESNPTELYYVAHEVVRLMNSKGNNLIHELASKRMTQKHMPKEIGICHLSFPRRMADLEMKNYFWQLEKDRSNTHLNHVNSKRDQ